MYDYEKLPENLQGGMRRYVEQGIKPGHFLTGVLENNLIKAVNYADEDSLKEIVNIVNWVHWEIPMGLWGNEESVETHMHTCTIQDEEYVYSDLTPMKKAVTVVAEEVFGDVHSV